MPAHTPVMSIPTTATVAAKGRVTIPKAIREGLGLHEGDRVVFHLTATGVELVPVESISRDQAWFYSSAIQARVAAAERDIREGRVVSVESEEELQAHLDSLKAR